MHILRIQIIAVFFMLFPCSTWALGLGNIDVQSNIGEPLSASVIVFGANSKTGADCFRLRRQNDGLSPEPLTANISFKKQSDGSAVLNIRSNQVFFDPILEISVISTCEDQIERNYTVLLDPPIVSKEVVSTSSVTTISNDNTLANTPAIEQVSEKKSKKKSKKNSILKNAQTIPSDKNTDVAMTASKEISSEKPKTVKKNSEGESRVLISGGAYSGNDQNSQSLALRMETTMTGSQPAETVGQVLELNDLSDDMTAMSNKLAHLESQIVKLEQRNQYLESLHLAKDVKLPNTTAPIKNKSAESLIKKEDDKSGDSSEYSWWYLLLVIPLAIVVFVAEWYRRRKQNLYLEASSDDDLWEPDSTKFEDDDLLDIENNALSSNPTKSTTAKSSRAETYIPPRAPEITEVNEGILEQAEVFVAHGRTSLAITLLQDHLHDHPKTSPAPWLLLLSLLKREPDEAAYEKAAEECRRYFNFYIPDYAEPVLDDKSSIEDYPSAKELVVNAWGSEKAIPVLEDLIYNRRNEARQGFDRNAYIDILLLRSIAQSQNLTDLSAMSDLSSSDDLLETTKSTIADEEVVNDRGSEELKVEENIVFSESEVSSLKESQDTLIETGTIINKDEPLDFNFELPVDDTQEEIKDSSLIVQDESILIEEEADKKPIDKSVPLDFNVEFKI